MQHLLDTDSGKVLLDKLPSKCPFCKKSIVPVKIASHLSDSNCEVYFSCPAPNCLKGFIGYYKNLGKSQWIFENIVTRGELDKCCFSQSINDISSKFEEIYNQAFSAEQLFLTEICGAGYRKALEFLIKDYCIYLNPSESEKIKLKLLNNCIQDYVKSDNIQNVSKRASWLGNDETHYVRKWESKDLSDLKKLISLVVHWIEAEEITKSIEDEMPG